MSVRLAPASGKRSTRGLLFRKTAPTQNIIGSAFLVVSCRTRGVGDISPAHRVCHSCWPFWSRRGYDGSCHLIFKDADLLKDTLLLLNLSGSATVLDRKQLRKSKASAGLPISWNELTNCWLGAQKWLDSLLGIFDQQAATASGPGPEEHLLRFRALGKEYRFNLVNKNRVLTLPLWLPNADGYCTAVSVKSNNLCSAFVKEMMAFRSSLEPCTFSRYRCPSK